MSAILQGADKAYLREYEESADKKRLYALKSALDSVQQETKNAGYIQNGLVLDIQLAVRRIYEDLGMDVSDGSPYDKAEDAVRKATSDLESAIYSLDEQIKLEIKEVNSSISNTELGELEESPTYVDGFMGADGKLTSKPTAADYASNKEFQHIKKKLGDRIPQPTKRDKDGKLSPFKKDELDEMYDEKAFDNIFKDRKDKGTMERPKSKLKPKDTGMYNQPNKADKDKEGEQLTEEQFDEAAGKKDACYHKVKARYDVWPSAYASGALVKCRKVGASNWGKTTTKEDEELDEAGTNCWKGYEKKGTKKMFGKTVNNCVKKESVEAVDEDLKAWFGKGKDGGAGGGGWDAYDGSGNRTGKCGDTKGEAKPKCLSKSKAASLRSSGGKKAIGAAVKKKRRNDPNKDRKGKAKNVSSKTNESNILKGLNESQIQFHRQLDEGIKEKLIAAGLAGAIGLGSLMPSAEDSPLGKELQAAAQAGDAVAAYHLNNLDLYTDEGMARTLVNLKIAYIDDSPREDVKAFLSDPKRFPALARK